MASRRTTQTSNSLKSKSADSKGLKSGNGASATKPNKSATAKKPLQTAAQSNGNIVPSRYMQAVENSSLSKSNSHNNDSGSLQQKFLSPKPSLAKCTPPRCSMGSASFSASKASRQDASLVLRKTVLQSTFSDGHCLLPDFDVSSIGEYSKETEKSQDGDKKWIEMQVQLLTFLSAKMADSMAKVKPKVEARLLQQMEEAEALHSELIEKKRHYFFMEKRKQNNNILDLQISALTAVSEAAKPFTESYKNLASAVDTTRHELPVKNFHIADDGLEFLGKAEACLKESEALLRECTEGDDKDNRVALECLKSMKRASKDMTQQLSGVVSELLELSSLVSRHNVLVQQAVEEEHLGSARVQELFCPK